MNERFRKFAGAVAGAAGSPWAFTLAVLSILVWSITGPVFKFSDTWQLVVNTGTTVVTFLMVFLIQNTQNRDAKAIHAKLDELIESGEASNRFTGLEDASEEELQAAQEYLKNRRSA